MTESTMRAVRSSTPWNRKNRYSAPSIPPAGSFTASSASSRTDRSNHPQIPPTRRKKDLSATDPWLFSFKGREACEHEEPVRCDGGESGKDPAGEPGAAKWGALGDDEW